MLRNLFSKFAWKLNGLSHFDSTKSSWNPHLKNFFNVCIVNSNAVRILLYVKDVLDVMHQRITVDRFLRKTFALFTFLTASIIGWKIGYGYVQEFSILPSLVASIFMGNVTDFYVKRYLFTVN